ncbi:ArnT family glycosyltransferase [Thermogutta sp.]|uniref:ArnT family glycosyltransferase n=1 Tax=Thermogutta sp. TaxID=1962930 RepID=UPI003C7E33A1
MLRFGGGFIFGDSESYWHLARAIARGEPYQYGVTGAIFRTPGYPLLLAPLFLVFDDPPIWLARLEGAVLGAVTGVLVCLWGKELFNRHTGILAGILTALHPELILGSIPVLSEAGFAPAWVLGMLLFAHSCRQSDSGEVCVWRSALGVGVAFGLATLIRPSALLWLPFLAIVQLLIWRHLLPSWQAWAATVAGFALVMAPWWVRNYWMTGRIILTTTQVGASLYDAWNPQASGGSNMDFVVEKLREVQRNYPDADPLFWELELDRRLKREAVTWAIEHPTGVLWLAFVKVRRFWNIVPNDPGFNVFPVNLVMAVAAVLTFALAIVGMLRGYTRRVVLMTCVLPAVYFTLLHMVFVSSLRYRIPVVPGLIVLASSALALRSFPRRSNKED